MNAVTNGSRFNLLPMNSLSREMNRLIGDLASDNKCAGCAPVSIWEDDKHFFLEFDLPGVSAEDVDVKVIENVLYLAATRPIKSDVEFLRQERMHGTIERQFSLPARIDDSQIEAELKGGVLMVTVPKAPESQVKKIEVKSN